MPETENTSKWIWHRDEFILECPYCHAKYEFTEEAKKTYGYFISLVMERCFKCGRQINNWEGGEA